MATSAARTSTAAVEGQTVARDVPRRRSTAHGDRVALRWQDDDERWGEWTFAEYADQVARAAAGLRGRGRRRRATASC